MNIKKEQEEQGEEEEEEEEVAFLGYEEEWIILGMISYSTSYIFAYITCSIYITHSVSGVSVYGQPVIDRQLSQQ